MKNYRLTILLSCCLVTLIQSHTLATTQPQPEGKDIAIESLPSIDRSIAESIAEQLGLGSIFQGILDFLELLGNTTDQILEARTPDWNVVKAAIEDHDTRGKELGRQLENRESDSFSINQDEAEQVQRLLIQDSVATSTTSKEAREAAAASLVELEATLKKSESLAQDSARTDVSQQILQNLSAQTGINAQLLGTISAQNIQAQKDRANQINLALQEARHASMQSTRHRRESLAAADLGTNAWGIVSTPTFLYEP
jgi:hypothetical protein